MIARGQQASHAAAEVGTRMTVELRMQDASWIDGVTPIVFVKPIGIVAGDALRLLELAKRLPMPVRWRLAPAGVAADVYIAHAFCLVGPQDAATLPVDSQSSGWAASSAETQASVSTEPLARPVCILGRNVDTSALESQELAPLQFPDALREMERELHAVMPELLGTRMLFTIGALAWEQRSRWPTRSLHAMESGELIAVVDTQHWKLYLRDGCSVERMARANLVTRPQSSGFSADGFHAVKLEAALWEFAKRCPEEALGDMLPKIFLRERLTHRRTPHMRKQALGEHCVAILRALDLQSHTAEELKSNLRLSEPALMRALTCLALVRAIQPESRLNSGLVRGLIDVWRKLVGRPSPYSVRQSA
jgi:hypothetical protein